MTDFDFILSSNAMTPLLESSSETRATHVVRDIADVVRNRTMLQPTLPQRLPSPWSSKDEEQMWERVRTGVRTFGVVRNSCDDDIQVVPVALHDRTCQPCQSASSNNARSQITNPGSGESGSGTCILLFYHSETVKLLLLAVLLVALQCLGKACSILFE